LRTGQGSRDQRWTCLIGEPGILDRIRLSNLACQKIVSAWTWERARPIQTVDNFVRPSERIRVLLALYSSARRFIYYNHFLVSKQKPGRSKRFPFDRVRWPHGCAEGVGKLEGFRVLGLRTGGFARRVKVFSWGRRSRI